MRYTPVDHGKHRELRIVDVEGLTNFQRFLQFPMRAYGNFQARDEKIDFILTPVNRFLSSINSDQAKIFVEFMIKMHSKLIVCFIDNKNTLEVMDDTFDLFIQNYDIENSISEFIDYDEEYTVLKSKFTESIPIVSKEFRKTNEEFTIEDAICLTKMSMLCKVLSPIFGLVLNQLKSNHEVCASLVRRSHYVNILDKMSQYMFHQIARTLSSNNTDKIDMCLTAHRITKELIDGFIVKNLVNSSLNVDKGNLITYFTNCVKRETWLLNKKLKKEKE